MPISRYFDGNGEKVMSNLQSEYGPETATRVFYALANKNKQKPEKPKRNYEIGKK